VFLRQRGLIGEKLWQETVNVVNRQTKRILSWAEIGLLLAASLVFGVRSSICSFGEAGKHRTPEQVCSKLQGSIFFVAYDGAQHERCRSR
jgi:hypothetical protein